jgi:hypothetical protein
MALPASPTAATALTTPHTSTTPPHPDTTRETTPMPTHSHFFVPHPSDFVHAVSSSAPPSPAPATCSTNHAPAASVLCHSSSPWAWLSQATAWLWHAIQVWWPLLTVTAVAALVVGAVLSVALRRARAEAATHARWVEITPPAVLPVDGSHRLWQALAGLLSRTRRHGLVPRQLAVEFLADSAGMRVGVWVPPTLSARSVAEVITRCWPGSRATIIRNPPTWEDIGTTERPKDKVSALHVLPHGDQWTPLVDPTHTTSRTPYVGYGRQTSMVDPLHSVLAALAERDETERACAQLVVTRVPRRIVGRGHRGGHRGRRRGRSLWAWIGISMVRAPFVILLFIADLFLSHGSTTKQPVPASTPTPEDPFVAAERKAIAAKKAHGPHLHATLRLAISSPSTRRETHDRYRPSQRAVRRAELNAIVNGYDVAAPQADLITCRVSRPARRLSERRPGPGRHQFVITIDEAAALWHLPAEPAQYGIADATARIRRPRRDLPRYQPRRINPRRRPERRDEGGHDAAA